MEEVKVAQLKCRCCYLDFPAHETHYKCATPTCSMLMCGPCFPLWIKGKSRDNKGYIRPKCTGCNKEIDYSVVRTLLGDEFERYDAAMVRMTLASMHQLVVFCPGVDCHLAYFKPPSRKEKKRNAPGIMACQSHTCTCGTTFCSTCGELWTAQHEHVTCVEYAAWKAANDADSIALAQWLKENPANQVKRCPGCAHVTQKNGGCNSHNCTLCGTAFCWACLGLSGKCKCGRLLQKKRQAKLKQKARRDRKKAEAQLAAKQRLLEAFLNSNNSQESASVFAIETTTVERARATAVVEVTTRTLASPSRVLTVAQGDAPAPVWQDWDVVVLNPRPREVPVEEEPAAVPAAKVPVPASGVVSPNTPPKQVKGGWQVVGAGRRALLRSQ